MTKRARWGGAATAARIGLVVAALVLVTGCSCNANTSLNQIYCEAYEGSTTGPALVVLGAFFIFVVFSIWLFRRIYRPRPLLDFGGRKDEGGEAPAVAPPWTVAGLGTRPAADVLDELSRTAGVVVRASESYEGTWLVDMTVPFVDPPVEFISPWTTHERACQLAIDVLVERDLVREGPVGSGAAGTPGS
jgi:hypothetical protein